MPFDLKIKPSKMYWSTDYPKYHTNSKLALVQNTTRRQRLYFNVYFQENKMSNLYFNTYFQESKVTNWWMTLNYFMLDLCT